PSSGIMCNNHSGLDGAEYISFAVRADETYYVVVDGVQDSGDYTVTFDLSDGTCADPVPALVWNNGSYRAQGNTMMKPTAATHSCGGALASEVVYELRPTFTGGLDVSLSDLGLGYSALLAARAQCNSADSE